MANMRIGSSCRTVPRAVQCAGDHHGGEEKLAVKNGPQHVLPEFWRIAVSTGITESTSSFQEKIHERLEAGDLLRVGVIILLV